MLPPSDIVKLQEEAAIAYRRARAAQDGISIGADPSSAADLARLDQAALFEAARLLGLSLSDEAILRAQGVAWLENRSPKARLSWGDSHNWGAVVYQGSREPEKSWGYFEHMDTTAGGKADPKKFQRYPDDVEGAKHFLRTLLNTKLEKQAIEVSPQALAEAQYLAGYYSGHHVGEDYAAGQAKSRNPYFPPPRTIDIASIRAKHPEYVHPTQANADAANIAEYGAGIGSSVSYIRKLLNQPVTPGPTQDPGPDPGMETPEATPGTEPKGGPLVGLTCLGLGALLIWWARRPV